MEWSASRRTDKRHVPSCGVHRINMEAHELSLIYLGFFLSSAQGADGPRGRVGERGDEGFEVSQIHRYFILMIFRMSSPYNIIKLYFVTGTNRNVWIRRIEGSFNYYFFISCLLLLTLTSST